MACKCVQCGTWYVLSCVCMWYILDDDDDDDDGPFPSSLLGIEDDYLVPFRSFNIGGRKIARVPIGMHLLLYVYGGCMWSLFTGGFSFWDSQNSRQTRVWVWWPEPISCHYVYGKYCTLFMDPFIAKATICTFLPKIIGNHHCLHEWVHILLRMKSTLDRYFLKNLWRCYHSPRKATCTKLIFGHLPIEQWSKHSSNPSWLGYIGDYATQL